MALLRNLVSRHLHTLTLHSLKIPPFPRSPFTTSPQPQHNPLPPNPHNHQYNKKPLHALFMEAVGLNDKTASTTPQEESEDSELQKNLRQLEEEVRSLKVERAKGKKKDHGVMRNTKKKRSLFAVFTNQPHPDGGDDDDEGVGVGNVKNNGVKVREPMVLKELSPEMEVFLEHLFRMGYFRDANFAKGKRIFDVSLFESYFARGYIKFAAQRFGTDNQEIAKWLSGSALKQVAMFGCPSVDRGSVFPAKRLRKFFEVPENTVCSKCTLRQSCKFENQSVWKGDTKTLDLVVVMKVLTSYALELVHPQLEVPDDVNTAVNQLLREVVKLSQTT